MKKIIALLFLLPSIALAQYYGPPYNPSNTQINGQPAGTMANQNANAVAITGGTATFTGTVSTTGNLNVQGLLSSTQNTQPAGTTNSGVALSAAPNVADLLFFDASQTANNRTYESLAFQGCHQFRFKNDAGNAATAWLSACGGQAAGITGITSNSGSGVWAHTGNMNVSGTFNATGTLGSSANNAIPSPTNSGVTIGGGSNWANAQFYDQAASANNRTAAFNWSGGVFSFWFRSDAGTAITPLSVSGGQGSGITGIAMNTGSGSLAITGSVTSTGNITASGASSNISAGGVISSNGGVQLPNATVATLPNCSAGSEGLMYGVRDATSPSYNGTLTGGGSVHIPAYCNGTAWVAH